MVKCDKCGKKVNTTYHFEGKQYCQSCFDKSDEKSNPSFNMKKRVIIVIVGVMIIIGIGLAYDSVFGGHNKFVLINKCNVEIEVVIWAYDSLEGEDWVDGERYSTYIDANSEVTIPNELKGEIGIDLHVYTSEGHKEWKHLESSDISMFGGTGISITFHQDGTYDYEYLD